MDSFPRAVTRVFFCLRDNFFEKVVDNRWRVWYTMSIGIADKYP
nr:MAG TPA: hypothetical protein [Caudoviricetes sp.]